MVSHRGYTCHSLNKDRCQDSRSLMVLGLLRRLVNCICVNSRWWPDAGQGSYMNIHYELWQVATTDPYQRKQRIIDFYCYLSIPAISWSWQFVIPYMPANFILKITLANSKLSNWFRRNFNLDHSSCADQHDSWSLKLLVHLIFGVDACFYLSLCLQ